jgi:hypothetical protein
VSFARRSAIREFSSAAGGAAGAVGWVMAGI